MTVASWKEVLDFWFDPKHVPLHFVEDPEFDELIRTKFLETCGEMISEPIPRIRWPLPWLRR